jgi:hypothetical protein
MSTSFLRVWLPQNVRFTSNRNEYSLFRNPVTSEPLCDRPNSCEQKICRRTGFRNWLFRVHVVLFLCLQGPDAHHALRINRPFIARFVDISEIGSTPVVQDEHEIVEGVRGLATIQLVQWVDYLVLAERLLTRRVLLEYYVTETLGTQKNRDTNDNPKNKPRGRLSRPLPLACEGPGRRAPIGKFWFASSSSSEIVIGSRRDIFRLYVVEVQVELPNHRG